MCEATIIIGTVTAALSAAQQQQNQRVMVDHRQKMAEATFEASSKAAGTSYAAALERASQGRQAAALEMQQASQDARAAIATAAVATGEAGANQVFDDVVNTIAIQASDYQAVRQRNLDWEEDQIMRSMEGIQAQQESRNMAGMGQTIAGIDYAGILGGLLKSGLEGYSKRPPGDTGSGGGTWQGALRREDLYNQPYDYRY